MVSLFDLDLVTLLVTSFIMIICCRPTEGNEAEEFNKRLKRQAYRNDSDIVSPCTPVHVHISFGNGTSSMKIMWATDALCDDCEVQYGTNSESMQSCVTATYTYFTQKNSKGLQHLYMSEVQNLVSNTTYYYNPVCGSDRSGPYYFHIPPNSTDWAAEYLVFGDMGMQTGSIQEIIREAQSGDYTALIHAGDIAYQLFDEGGQVGDSFMSMIEPAASFLPYLTCPGNHEIEKNLKFSHYRHRFAMPYCDWPARMDKMWYSIDIGPVHFISYSTEVFFIENPKCVKAQKDWLLQDLEEANSRRHLTPWVIAFGHRPLYCSTRIGDDCSLEVSQVRLGVERIFYEMKVDILLEAHEHNYERLWPVYQGEITDSSYRNTSSPIQIITGAAGSHLGTDHFVRGDQPKWSAFRIAEPAFNSYGRMLVQNRTHIWWEQRSALDHRVIDKLWIIKDEGFQRSANIPYAKPVQRNHYVIVGTLVLCVVSLLIFIGVVRCIVVTVLKKKFDKSGHAPLTQEDDFEDEEEVEFSQHNYHTSLI